MTYLSALWRAPKGWRLPVPPLPIPLPIPNHIVNGAKSGKQIKRSRDGQGRAEHATLSHGRHSRQVLQWPPVGLTLSFARSLSLSPPGRGLLSASLLSLWHPCNCVSLCPLCCRHTCVCLCDGISMAVEECQKCISPLCLFLFLWCLAVSVVGWLWPAIVLQRSPLEPCAKCQVQMAKFLK